MRLAVFIDDPIWFDGLNYTAEAPFINFVLSFESCVDSLLIFAPVCESAIQKGLFTLNVGSKVRIIARPFFKNTSEMYTDIVRIIMRTVRVLNREIPMWDICWIVANHMPDIFYERLLVKKGKKTFFYIRGNIVKDVKSHKISGIKALAALAVAHLTYRLLRRSIRKGTPAFVVGNELMQLYAQHSSQVFKVNESLIKKSDIARIRRESVSHPFILISVGRLTPEKDLDLLVDAISLLIKEEKLDIYCKIVGTGKSAGNLRKKIIDEGVESYFEHVGFIPPGKELYEQYDEADVYVLTSYTEGLPKTLYEAMARGLPIVATDVGGVSELVVDGENGFLIPRCNPLALAEKIKKLYSSSSLRERFSQAALEKVKQYTMEISRDRMFETIRSEILNR